METRNKITADMVMQWERDAMIDALCDGSLELTDAFLDRYAGEHLRYALKAIPERDRAFHLDGYIDASEAYFNGGIPSLGDDSFLLPCDEIETPIESVDDLAEPDEFTINGNLAYLYIGYGLTVRVDVDGLTRAYQDWAGE